MRRSFLLPFVTLLAFAPALFAAKAEVVDNAGFFSADAVAEANQTLARVEKETGRQMRVETYASIPDNLRAKYSDANRRQFFQDWARKRAQDEGLTGVIVLLCREPSSLQVEVGNKTASSGAFTQSDRSALSQQLLAAMRAKDYDRGLLDAVKMFGTTVAKAKPVAGGAKSGVDALPVPDLGGAKPTQSPPAAQPAPRPQQSPGNRGGSWSWGAIIFIGILVFVGFSILRRLFAGGIGGNRPPLGPGQHQGYGEGAQHGQQFGSGGAGGGFGRGFGGGLLGGLLGGWAANEIFRHSTGNSANAAPPPPMDSGTFNEPSSGADFGGGDFGGGDFSGGGGDAGGGGGDF